MQEELLNRINYLQSLVTDNEDKIKSLKEEFETLNTEK
jgi:hypothetical protein